MFGAVHRFSKISLTRFNTLGRVLALGALSAVSIAQQPAASTPASTEVGGHCSFNLQNQWAGPYKACIDPSTAPKCDETGKRDQNTAAIFSTGSCPTAGRVGTCAKPDASVHYYDGEASSLEMGCGFQGGSWKNGQ